MTRKEERQLIYNKYNGRCAYCGEKLKKGWHVDHLEPVKRTINGGEKSFRNPEKDSIENKMPSCASCNINKHSMSIERFRKVIAGYVTSLNEYITQYRMAKKYGLVKETGEKVKFYFETFK